MQVFQLDAPRARIGEGFVLAAGAGEFGVDVEAVADVADDQERRPGFAGREQVDVALALGVGAVEGLVPGGGSALAVAGGRGDRGGVEGGEQRLVGVGLVAARVDALLGFEDEVERAEQVDPVWGGGAVRFAAVHAALEGVGVEFVFRPGRVGLVEAEEVAEFE